MATTFHIVITKDGEAGQDRVLDFHGSKAKCKAEADKVLKAEKKKK